MKFENSVKPCEDEDECFKSSQCKDAPRLLRDMRNVKTARFSLYSIPFHQAELLEFIYLLSWIYYFLGKSLKFISACPDGWRQNDRFNACYIAVCFAESFFVKSFWSFYSRKFKEIFFFRTLDRIITMEVSKNALIEAVILRRYIHLKKWIS